MQKESPARKATVPSGRRTFRHRNWLWNTLSVSALSTELRQPIEVASERSSGLRVFGISPRVVAPPRWSRKRYLNIETALKAKDVQV